MTTVHSRRRNSRRNGVYVFDFGANQRFSLTVLCIEPGGKVSDKRELQKTVGKPPERYAGLGG